MDIGKFPQTKCLENWMQSFGMRQCRRKIQEKETGVMAAVAICKTAQYKATGKNGEEL